MDIAEGRRAPDEHRASCASIARSGRGVRCYHRPSSLETASNGLRRCDNDWGEWNTERDLCDRTLSLRSRNGKRQRDARTIIGCSPEAALMTLDDRSTD